MNRIQRRLALGLFTLLVTVAPAPGQQFSEWSVPVNLGPVVNSAFGDFFPAISKDGLSLYFSSSRTGPDAQGLLPQGGSDIYVSQRKTVKDDWGPPHNLGPMINTSFNDLGPSLSVDGHFMYFASNRPTGFGGNDIYVSRRHDKRDDFGWQLPENVGNGVNTDANEASPAIFEDDATGVTTLYFDSNRPGGPGPFTDDIVQNGNDIYASILESEGTFGPAVLVAELSTPFLDRQLVIRRDGLEIFFASNRPGGKGFLDLWVSTRATTLDPWGTPVNLQSPQSPINTGGNDAGPALSFDGTRLYFHSVGSVGGSTAFDLFVTTRTKLKGQPKEQGVDRNED